MLRYWCPGIRDCQLTVHGSDIGSFFETIFFKAKEGHSSGQRSATVDLWADVLERSPAADVRVARGQNQASNEVENYEFHLEYKAQISVDCVLSIESNSI